MPQEPFSMLLYKLFLFCYPKIIKLLGFFNPKAKQWSLGQSTVWDEIEANLLKSQGHPIIWVHAASYGEFEQGLPIIQQLKSTYPSHKIWLTFFSPSGYLHRKNDPAVDYVTYLPFDSATNAQKFIELLKPSLILFIKYEFWFHYLTTASKNKIPTLLVAAIFREDQLFFKWYGGLFRKMLLQFSFILTQDEVSYNLIKPLVAAERLFNTGDTRFDRVVATTKEQVHFDWIPLLQSKPILVAGSTWPSDHDLLTKSIATAPNLNWIIVPHHVDQKSIATYRKQFPGCITLTELENEIEQNNLLIDATQPVVLIIDRIGILRHLYKYAFVSYIGGGFTKDGIHNVLEPAAFGHPVLWGSNDTKYREAAGLIINGGGQKINDSTALTSFINHLLNHPVAQSTMGLAAKEFVMKNAGGTEKTIQIITNKALL